MARVSATSLIHFQRNRYSVPCEWAHASVSIRAYPDRLVVIGPGPQGQPEAVTLVRSIEREQTIYDWRHYITLLERKPGALRNGAPFKTMPPALQQLQAHLLRHAGGDRVMAQVLTAITLHGLDDVLVAIEVALQSGRISADHVLNVLARLKEPCPPALLPEESPPALALIEPPRADVTRYDRLRQGPAPPGRTAMSNDIAAALKSLSLHGMASAWPELLGMARLKAMDHEALVHQLIKAEGAHREVRSMAYQMRSARFPNHRDLTGFAFDQAQVDEALVRQLHELKFVDSAHNVVFVGGPGTGKTHLATSLGIHAIRAHGKRVRFFSTIELVNLLEAEKIQGKAGQLAHRLMYVDLVILDEMGYLPFSQPAAPCCFTCYPNSTSAPAWSSPPTSPSGVGQRLWRPQDDHCAARSPDPPLPHRGDRQPELAVSKLQRTRTQYSKTTRTKTQKGAQQTDHPIDLSTTEQAISSST